MVRWGKGKRDIGWSAAEDGLLRDHYPDYQALREHLPHRTLSALKHRVRAIGIVARRHVWMNIEVARLRKAYTDGVTDHELVVLFPGLRLCQIKSKASHICAERRGLRPAHFGEPALGAIRTRSKAMQLSFVELDRDGTVLPEIQPPSLSEAYRAGGSVSGFILLRALCPLACWS